MQEKGKNERDFMFERWKIGLHNTEYVKKATINTIIVQTIVANSFLTMLQYNYKHGNLKCVSVHLSAMRDCILMKNKRSDCLQMGKIDL